MADDLRRVLSERVVIFDGAMGTSLQGYDLGPDDFEGLDGCNEMLVATRPEVVREIHAAYFAAGCDVVETNTFGCNTIVLGEYDIAHRAKELSRRGAELAREVASDFSTPDRPRFVCGSVGPGTKLPTVGHIDFRSLKASYVPQFEGLLEGGVDAVIIETCQDLLQIKATIDAAREAFGTAGRSVPIFVSVTIEANGAMLVGSDVAAAVASLTPLGIDSLGVNCATGPEEMKRRIETLSRLGPPIISAMPNAGLPQNVDGQVVYPLGPDDFARWVERFVVEDGVGIVGGCCGTTPAHLKALAELVWGRAPSPRVIEQRSEGASIFQAMSFEQEPPPLVVGERLNANGSKEFRERLLEDDLDGMLAVAREQERGGAHVLDVSVAYVGRDEQADMDRLVSELARSAKLPLMFDSTSPAVLEAALERYGGRALINSINLEDGPEKMDEVVRLAKRFGAALVALVIDEEGMARTVERKLAIAQRIYDKVVGEHGMRPQDLIFDMLTFTVASGDVEMRDAAVQTLDAIEALKRQLPGVHTILGVSNVSFGLRPAARRALNSVFLSMAVQRGLDQAIVNARGIVPLNRIPDDLRDTCRRLLLADWSQGDPLAELLTRFEKKGVLKRAARENDDRSTAERLRDQVIDGAKKGLEKLLDQLVADGVPPLQIINEHLIGAMKVVGELFGSGEMQLPFVLQSAEVMKAAVRHLEPLMESGDRAERGTLVLATVKGDVHDIGKNLVDIILTNNGYRVVNLGIKVPVEEMLAAIEEHGADALGMSGLLVKSTVIMRENLQEMARRGLKLPVLLGGAALTRDYVERDLRDVYGPQVHYCQDAFDGLNAMTALTEGAGSGQAAADPDPDPLERPRAESDRAISLDTPQRRSRPRVYTGDEGGGDELPAPEVDRSVATPSAPYQGDRVIDEIPLDEVYGLLNETTLFRGQWRYRRGNSSREEYAALVENEVRPLFEELKARCKAEDIFAPRAVIGWYPCHAEGRTVVVHDPASPGGAQPLARFEFPRRRSAPHHCISDYFRPLAELEAGAPPDLIGMFVATAGGDATRHIQDLFAANRYRDYLHLHGLAVEVAEATAEWVHAEMRRAAGIDEGVVQGGAGAAAQGIVRQGYRGSRYSFGYPACPDLTAQAPLFELLRPERIGVSLSDGFQMHPEQSVSAIVVHHPGAKYFNLD